MWLWLLSACTPEPPGGKHTADPTTTTGCPTGQVLDGEVCVPEACGTGTWGSLPMDENTIYVVEGGHGDGTESSPLGSIQAALDLAGKRNGGLVAVAAGTYQDTVSMGSDHDGVTLAGRCREMVTIDGGEGEEVPVIGIFGDLSRRRPEIGVEGVTVTRGRYGGVWVERAVVTVQRVDVVANTAGGVLALDAEVTLGTVSISDTQPDRRGAWGWSVFVQDGATLTATDCTVEGNTEIGVYASDHGTTVELVDTVVRGTNPNPDGSDGRGINAQDGATLTATRCTVEGNTGAGVYAGGDGTTVDLVDTAVRDTNPNPDGSDGKGVEVNEGAALTATGSTVEGNTGVGLLASDNGTTVRLVDAVVRDTQPRPDGSLGRGIEVNEGAALTAWGCVVQGNTEIGLAASDDGTTVELGDTVVSDTTPSPDGSFGRGIAVGMGAAFTATGCTVGGNTEFGVFAVAAGTTVELVDTVVQDTAPSPDGSLGRGLNIQEAATLTATGCTVQGNTDLGVFAGDDGTTVELVDTVVRATVPGPDGRGGGGVWVQGGAALAATGCTVEGNTELGVLAALDGTTVELVDTVVQDTAQRPDGWGGRGISVEEGATLTATGCTVQGNTEFGVFATNEGTTVELVDTVVRDTRRGVVTGFALGGVAQQSARLTLDSCTVSGTEGPGLYATGGAHVSVTSTSSTANSFAGALVLDAITTLDDVTITDTAPDAQWGGGFGVYAVDLAGPPSVTLTHSTIGPHPYAAVWLDGDGTYLLEDNDVSGNLPQDLRGRPIHGNAVFAERGVRAWDGTSGLSLIGNRLHGATDVAVLLDQSSASLDGNTFDTNGTDVWQQRCDDVAALVSPEPDWVVCDGGTLLTDSATQFTTLYLPEVEPE